MKLSKGFMDLHPSLSRRRVWCTVCGSTQKIQNGFRDGWPKCCGQTMTIDSPEERAEFDRRAALDNANPQPREVSEND